MAAAASTWTNIATKLNSCASELDTVCSSRLAGQESLAVATFKTLQAGSASHLRMTGQLAGAISGGLTVASMIVRMVHDMVRDAISDVIGKLASKVAIGVLTAGLAAPWAVSTAITEVSSWVTRLSKEVADTVLSAKNLKGLLSKANRLLDDVAAAFTRIPAKVSKAVTTKVEAAKDLAASLRNPQYALTGLPGISMRQAGDMGRAKPTVHRPTAGPTPPKTPRPNPNEGRWGVKLDDAASTTKRAPARRRTLPLTEPGAPATQQTPPPTEPGAPATQQTPPPTEPGAPATQQTPPPTEPRMLIMRRMLLVTRLTVRLMGPGALTTQPMRRRTVPGVLMDLRTGPRLMSVIARRCSGIRSR